MQPFQHYSCFVSLGTCAKGVQFLCPSHTYPVIPYCTIFPYLAHSSDGVTYPLTQTAQHFHLPTQQLIFDKEKITIPPPQSNFLKSSSKLTVRWGPEELPLHHSSHKGIFRSQESIVQLLRSVITTIIPDSRPTMTFVLRTDGDVLPCTGNRKLCQNTNTFFSHL